MLRGLALGRLIPAVLMMSVAIPTSAAAQECGGAGRYQVRLRPGLIEFPAPTIADYDAGWLLAPIAEIRVQPVGAANRGWEVCLRADSPTLGGYGKPVSDIEFRQDGTGAWVPLSTSDQLLAVGNSIRTVELEFRLALDWFRDVPGRYETDFAATAASD